MPDRRLQVSQIPRYVDESPCRRISAGHRPRMAGIRGHFDRRKVELGNCARPYGTRCQHEHACLRCPVLQVDPRNAPASD
jgi:hypothetical protein